MVKQRKTYTEGFKHKVVVAILTSGKTTAEVATEFDISPSMVNEWKQDSIDGKENREVRKPRKELEDSRKNNEVLMKKIGEKELEVEVQKKDSALRREDLWKIVDPALEKDGIHLSIARQCRLLAFRRAPISTMCSTKRK